jgi:hypothetical protein
MVGLNPKLKSFFSSLSDFTEIFFQKSYTMLCSDGWTCEKEKKKPIVFVGCFLFYLIN